MMLFPAVLMNFHNSKVCLIGEWSITAVPFSLVHKPYSRGGGGGGGGGVTIVITNLFVSSTIQWSIQFSDRSQDQSHNHQDPNLPIQSGDPR